MDALDRLCVRLGRRRRCERVLARVLPAAAVSGLVGATALAVVRLAVPDAGWLAPTIAAAAALAPLALAPSAARRRDPPWLLAGHIDRLAGADGLAMAMARGGDPAWNERLSELLCRVRLPPLRLRGLPTALAAAALLAGAWFLPQATAPPPAPPVAGAGLAGVDSGLQRLADAGLATASAIEELHERLDAVREAMSAQGLTQQTWAALDALQRDIDTAAAMASDRLADALAKADALAGLTADGDAAALAAADLAAALSELEALAPGLAARLPAGTEAEALLRLAQQAMAGGELTEAQLQALQRWGLDPAQAQAAQAGDPAAAQRLADRLAGELAQRAGMAGPGDGGPEGDGPGGGPGPGGGHPELTWGDGSRIDGGFRDRLAAGTPNAPEAGAAVGTQVRAPREDELSTSAIVRAAAVEHAPTAADARRAVIAPRHRTAVAGYFSAGTAP